mmetsp:Transcript_40325/g.78471  ORF Transcript_40325/g.78471 Transcript_40325/m.78471 type:complete len:140 (-) Transcript_40325:188-607(-)
MVFPIRFCCHRIYNSLRSDRGSCEARGLFHRLYLYRRLHLSRSFSLVREDILLATLGVFVIVWNWKGYGLKMVGYLHSRNQKIVLGILKTKILVDLLIMLVLEWSTFVAAQSDSWVLSWSVPGPEDGKILNIFKHTTMH